MTATQFSPETMQFLEKTKVFIASKHKTSDVPKHLCAERRASSSENSAEKFQETEKYKQKFFLRRILFRNLILKKKKNILL